MTRFKREAHSSVVLTNIRPPFLARTTSLRPESVYVHIGAVVPHCVIMVVNWCSLATDGVLAYVPPLCPPVPHLRWMLQPRWHFCFFVFSVRGKTPQWNGLSYLRHQIARQQMDWPFFWLFKGKRFCLIKLYKDGTGLFWKGFFFYFKKCSALENIRSI